MKTISFFVLCLSTCVALSASVVDSPTKRRALTDLDNIQSMFEAKYAPKEWKKEFANWDLQASIIEAKNRIATMTNPTLKECQVAIRDFFNSTQDYHVGVRFFSTESATLPFLIKGTEGRYFVCHVDRNQILPYEFPFDEGDEILIFDGRPIHEVVVELREREFGHNTLETDQALAELALTHRKGASGHTIPCGQVTITGIKKGSTVPIEISLMWQYTPEKIRDSSRIGLMAGQPTDKPKNVTSLLQKSDFFGKYMTYALWDKSETGSLSDVNRHDLGSRSSYIPPLGRKTWRTQSDSVFDAYIFVTASGRKIGYIRLPHYIGDEEELDEFGLIMNLFQLRTNALVIDQINNPGGSIFYLYALASTLTERPLYAPKHRLAMTQEEIALAYQILPLLDQATDDESARVMLGQTVGGYPVNFRFAQLTRDFCYFLVNQWDNGQLFTEPTHLFGIDKIYPHPNYRYTKPILLLTNALDFSGGDFFPAILQDNKRATVMGVRTAGAGGYVLKTSYPNHSGIKSFIMTGSLAERKNLQPIENLGVTPDLPYQLSTRDLQENYPEYVAAILQNIENLCRNRMR